MILSTFVAGGIITALGICCMGYHLFTSGESKSIHKKTSESADKLLFVGCTLMIVSAGFGLIK